MTLRDRITDLDRALDEALAAAPASAGDGPPFAAALAPERAVGLFEDMVRSRTLDIAARELQARGQGYYTIASAGHEHDVVLGDLLRPDDPCLLHYRSGALMMARLRLDPGVDPVVSTVQSFGAAAAEPVGQGRHKVWGSRPLWTPPQTSTIASHVPKATGLAFALERAHELGVAVEPGRDAVVCCSFGDASANHAAALAGINAARYARRRTGAAPILFVCEDNGLGISVPTPGGWIEATFGALPHLDYVRAGGELDQVWDTVRVAVERVRARRAPAFVHLPVVRRWAHAGSDVETAYRDPAELEAAAAADPLPRAVRRLTGAAGIDPDELRTRVERVRDEVAAAVERWGGAPTLTGRDEVMAPLRGAEVGAEGRSGGGTAGTATRTGAPGGARTVPAARRRADGADDGPDGSARRTAFRGRLPEEETAPTRRTLAAALNAALTDELLRRDDALVFGEDVGRKGGVYHVTANLQAVFGERRVFDTLLDETTILGIAQGAGMLGLLPIPEIQYLAYLHNALDQLRGEAGSLAFFSAGQFRNPMVVRIASFAYQRGFGGHFHNDNAIGALREIPGLVVAAPALPDDGARLLRTACRLAADEGRVVAFLEPIALYHQRDLHEEGDGGWLRDYPPPPDDVPFGEVGVHDPDARDLLLPTYANGVRMALRAARTLGREDGVRARVLDLRWLAPLPVGALVAHARECRATLVVDECRASGGVADTLVAELAAAGVAGPTGRVRSADSYIPLGPAADAVLLGEDEIVAAARALLGITPS